MTSNLKICTAKKKDLPGIIWLYSQPMFDNGLTISPALALKIFQRIYQYPDYKVYVAISKRKIVGSFALLIMDNLGHIGTPSGIIEDVVVDPTVQRKGIGRAMMTFARKICKDRGCYKMVLSSNLNRKEAHAFYKSLGFEKHGYSFNLRLEKSNG